MKKLLLIVLIGLLSTTLVNAQEDTTPPPNGMQPVAAWSVFNENFRNQMYDFALPYGRWLVNHRPKSLEGFQQAQYRPDRNFQRMITIYSHMADNSNDPIIREAYVDSALVLYDRALAIFDETEIDHFRWRFDRARFIQINQGRIEDGRRVTKQEYLELYQTDPARLAELADGYYVSYLVREMLTFEMRDEAIQLMLDAEQYAEAPLLSEFNEIRGSIFRSPEERIDFVTTQLEANPDDMNLKAELIELYSRTGNVDEVRRLQVELYEKDPNYENTMRMAGFASQNAEYNAAIRYLRQAVDLTTDNRKQAEINHQIADNYLNLRNLQQARDFAKRAQRLAPNWGDPIILEAGIYAQAVTECSSTLDRTDKVVYWLVVDILERAQRVDPNVRNTVQRQIGSYRGVTPNAEEKFYMGWNDGDTIRIDGSLKACYAWIGETTRIR
jgi:tetratricopeptide (TPR) repeat protein